MLYNDVRATKPPAQIEKGARVSQQQQIFWGHRLARWIATGFGVGVIAKAPGTFGTLIGIPLYLLLRGLTPALYAASVLVLFMFGVWICTLAERQLGRHDHPALVWDEVVGYLVTMFFAPAGWVWLVIGFILFRLFDIWKPFPIRRLERALHGGLGTMADDVLAGVYALVMLQIIVRLVSTDLA